MREEGDERIPGRVEGSAVSPGGAEAPHLEAGEIAAWLDRRLAGAEGRRIDAHLAECPRCRAEVTDLSALVRSGTPRRRNLKVLVPVAAAAAVALVFAAPWRGPTGPGEERQRAPGAAAEREGVPSLRVFAPAPGATLAAAPRTFVWGSAGEGATYRIVLAAPDGEIAWTEMTSDTAASLPPEVEPTPGSPYVWYVDALLPDGRSATTGVHRFEVRP